MSKTLLEAIKVLRSALNGHQHWDSQGNHGATCRLCQEQRKARDRADELVERFKDEKHDAECSEDYNRSTDCNW